MNFYFLNILYFTFVKHAVVFFLTPITFILITWFTCIGNTWIRNYDYLFLCTEWIKNN